MAIKSALMTTAYDVLDGGTPAPNTNPVLIFRQGAGHVQPNSAANPGLVYDSDFNDWLAFFCATHHRVSTPTCNRAVGRRLLARCQRFQRRHPSPSATWRVRRP